MFRYPTWITLGIFLLPLAAGASQVTRVGNGASKVWVSQDPEEAWLEKQKLCLFDGSVKVACGTVVEASAKGAVVKLDETLPGQTVGIGNEVRIAESEAPLPVANLDEKEKKALEIKDPEKSEAAKPEESKPSEEDAEGDSAKNDESGEDEKSAVKEETAEAPPAEEAPEEKKKMTRIEMIQYHRELIHSYDKIAGDSDDVTGVSEKLSLRYNLSVGGLLIGATDGGNSLWAAGHAQFGVNKNYAIGLMGNYHGFYQSNILVKGIGVLATFNYFPLSLYNGVNIKAGIGPTYTEYRVDSRVGGSSSTGSGLGFTASATMGWRFLFLKHINIGLEGGVEYFSLPQLNNTPNNTGAGSAQMFFPIFTLDAGFAF